MSGKRGSDEFRNRSDDSCMDPNNKSLDRYAELLETRKVLTTDVRRSISDNLKERINYWDTVKRNAEILRLEIEKLQQQLQDIPNNAEYRAKRADIRISIEELQEKIRSDTSQEDQIEYIGCIAKVVLELQKKKVTEEKPQEKEHQVVFGMIEN